MTSPQDKQVLTERDQTDASLKSERMNTDQALAETIDTTDDDADHVVGRARRHADAVLKTARERADRKVDECHVVARERTLEDEIVRDERALADDVVRREREEQAQVLRALLPLEREKTDRHLLTERADSDDALARRDDFLGIVAHDLRNLLGGIVLNANGLTAQGKEHDGGERTAAGMQRIQRYAARMNRLIGDLVDIVSIDAGRLSTRPETADATALLTEAIDVFSATASERGITLVAEFVERPLMAAIDHDRMMQVLANLITNAIKFTPRGGTITVGGSRSIDHLDLWVSDTGCGIERPLLEAVFERFWQFGDHDRRGLGLGLYISRCIVEAHGGKIWADSHVGEGSTFRLSIPAAAA